jgi:hypothetical protein
MSLRNAHEEMVLEDPIELVSRLIIAQDWFLKKTSAHALLADVPGRWGHYQLLADWHADTEVLNVEARLDVLVERKDELSVQRLLAELNTELYLGHFQLSPDRQHIILRCRLPLRGAGGATPEQIEDVVDVLLGQCEQAAPVLCQLVYGRMPEDIAATRLVMTPAMGEA